MGCIHSSKKDSQEYIETLTLRRQVSKKNAGKNLQISISLIADPMSSDDDSSTFTCHLQRSGVKKKCVSSHTISYAEGRMYTKFPNMVGYKMCTACNEPGQDVLKTVDPELKAKEEMCRKCSVIRRKASQKRKKQSETEPETVETISKVDIATFANLLALVSLNILLFPNVCVLYPRMPVPYLSLLCLKDWKV